MRLVCDENKTTCPAQRWLYLRLIKQAVRPNDHGATKRLDAELVARIINLIVKTVHFMMGVAWN